MAEGFASATADDVLDTVFDAGLYVKLHTGAPGAAGTSNAATETTRKAVTFDPASAGVKATAADIEWTGIAGSQDPTHISFWDHVSAGNFVASAALTSNPYTAGDLLRIPAGQTVTLGIAS